MNDVPEKVDAEVIARAKRALRDEGWCVIPGVLAPDRAAGLRADLWRAVEERERCGLPTRGLPTDPNEHNVRVLNLPEHGQAFVDLVEHPLALDMATALLGGEFLISNATANIALPGALSMTLHADQAIVVPEPWLDPWSVNVIWCFDDVREANGATRYVPGSHKVRWRSELPVDALGLTRAFEAEAGSMIVMDGRLWHTSGANVTENEERAMVFCYYSVGFVRPQVNWNAALPPGLQDSFPPRLRRLFGLDTSGNHKRGAHLMLRRPTMHERRAWKVRQELVADK
ncbi:MAG: phytanoyl-CoA dioxygenase family protein [Caulobacteraceae bacterium]|nr:phytanoyl-CoA dioxygenase family protein [Caulobacteraceae bacterium]